MQRTHQGGGMVGLIAAVRWARPGVGGVALPWALIGSTSQEMKVHRAYRGGLLVLDPFRAVLFRPGQTTRHAGVCTTG